MLKESTALQHIALAAHAFQTDPLALAERIHGSTDMAVLNAMTSVVADEQQRRRQQDNAQM